MANGQLHYRITVEAGDFDWQKPAPIADHTVQFTTNGFALTYWCQNHSHGIYAVDGEDASVPDMADFLADAAEHIAKEVDEIDKFPDLARLLKWILETCAQQIHATLDLWDETQELEDQKAIPQRNVPVVFNFSKN